MVDEVPAAPAHTVFSVTPEYWSYDRLVALMLMNPPRLAAHKVVKPTVVLVALLARATLVDIVHIAVPR